MTSTSTNDPLLSTVSAEELPDFTESMRLLAEAQGGDARALDDLLRRYEARLRRIVRIRLSATLRRVVESVDIVQETYRSAIGRIGDLEMRSTASILQWLARIAENQLVDTHRHFYGQKRDKEREVRLAEPRSPMEDSRPGAVPASPALPPDELASQEEIRRIVDDAVSELPDEYREVIMLRTYYGGSWEYVAEQMGRASAEATRQLHRRARIRLGRMVRERIADLG